MERLKSSSQQWQAAAIGLIFVCIGFMAKVFYREYIYSHHINDFGMADWLPSFFYVIGFSYLLMVSQVIAPLLITVIVTIASILFEIKPVSYTHLDVYKRQVQYRLPRRLLPPN